MRIHHLDCGTLRTPVGRMVCHVLLLEIGDRLVLVDTGFGTGDVRDPRRLAAEAAAIRDRRGPRVRQRYRTGHWGHGPHLVAHPRGARTWKGLEGTVELDDVAPGLPLVPLPGHTPGHAGVAVPTPEGWLLHIGDAALDARTLRTGRLRLDVRLRQTLVAQDPRMMHRTQRRLRALARDPEARIVTSHDLSLFEAARARNEAAPGTGRG